MKTFCKAKNLITNKIYCIKKKKSLCLKKAFNPKFGKINNLWKIQKYCQRVFPPIDYVVFGLFNLSKFDEMNPTVENTNVLSTKYHTAHYIINFYPLKFIYNRFLFYLLK